MDDYGQYTNYGLKLILGMLIGFIIILFTIPLVANIVATETVADAASDVLASMDTASSTLPKSTSNLITEDQNPVLNNTTNNPNSNSDSKGNSNNNQTPNISDMKILSGSITTGSSLSSKSECTVYVGSQYSGVNVMISTLYSRDGNNLNPGKQVSTKVDSKGYITVKSANSFDYYPDECMIKVYTSSGTLLDSKTVLLETESGTQNF